MNQQIYNGYSGKKKNKLKRVLIILVIIAAVFVVGIWCVGLIAGSDSEERQNVSSAIEENATLKIQVEELTAQVKDLQAQLDELNAQLAAGAVPAETPVPDASVPQEVNSGQVQ